MSTGPQLHHHLNGNLNHNGACQDWLRLMQTEGVGGEAARRLLAAFGLPDAIFSASFDALCAVVGERIARTLQLPPSTAMQDNIERAQEWAGQAGNRLL